jgi:hypothetical protein
LHAGFLQQGCSVCLDGAEFEYGARQLPGREDTCDSMQEFLDIFRESDCDLLHEIISLNNDFIDVPSFCGCVGAPIPNLCDSCDDHATEDATDEIALSVSFHDGRSCNDLEIVYPFVTDEDHCQLLVEACCNLSANPSTAAPTKSPSSSPTKRPTSTPTSSPSSTPSFRPSTSFPSAPPTKQPSPAPTSAPKCGICASGSYLGTPDLQVPFFEPATCASIDSDLSFIPASSCSGIQDQVNSILHVAAWCGCDGANPPAFCSFCDDESMIDPDFEIAGSGGLTCAAAANLARFVTDPATCSV